ncbi:DNA cross-link repair protein pso2/snm1 [Histoplasma capsulatum G186AR]|uniref:DNA cross-link repair protein pso2/snm1 n=2 Tax=Ajellomyces capsulatus TaxID=5037 RepID=C0P0R1_AJECG|nr:DNA cross-link repair protein pso2/snm1 [Histoplasma capsulatum G186AR]EEH02711.1 DNA cross-link repair protein pso2/snm1 [Histoplasma capsulatum G186AR]KAG5287279.1 DNA cross-link repair protein pso2/snm1 [Histoplasma capsulatum]QSS70910.1 DNA cross-link repair protein pso2/snm1 [Histoplasma capsulatum G186AR]
MSSPSPYFNANRNRGREASKFLQSSSKRTVSKRNTSILNFFKKSETPSTSSQNRITNYMISSHSKEEKFLSTDNIHRSGSLFFTEEVEENVVDRSIKNAPDEVQAGSESLSDEFWDAAESFDKEDRYNAKYNVGEKRQRVNNACDIGTSALGDDAGRIPKRPRGAKGLPSSVGKAPRPTRVGPFLDESDSEHESNCVYDKGVYTPETLSKFDYNSPTHSSNESHANFTEKRDALATSSAYSSSRKHSGHSGCREGGSLQDQNVEKYGEQRLGLGTLSTEEIDSEFSAHIHDNSITVCPVCNEALVGIAHDDLLLHVNNCLDGNPSPMPSKIPTPPVQSNFGISINRQEKAVIPRPGQINPLAMELKGEKISAFSKMMSSNAEDAAWEAAIAKEEASRGKQAHERTCPFYKIIPGFSTCVDAFRYGAIEGCTAYFLSHFHSDHYIGLTSSWCHGQIYCSTVTGNLVRQQLKVDPKWVTDIEFDQPFEIPRTCGARVTMLPANHCPGSSIFLFEKRVNKSREPKVRRILHCGDFRASPTHVQHPILRPNITDSLTGKVRQQIIDVCYLDTTYLNPKYAFPSQDDVVAACAAVCADLNVTEHGHSTDSECRLSHLKTSGKSDMDPQAPTLLPYAQSESRNRLLVVIGTYSIGKERLCMAIAHALNCKIYAPAAKQRILACLENSELSTLITNNPVEAQVHMVTMMDVHTGTLLDYLHSLKPHFSRVVGFRPTGWSYRPPAGRMTDSPPVSSILYSDSWKPRFGTQDLIPQRGSNQISSCYSVPYSEHSSFRELTMFCCALRITKVIPTVNVGSKRSREKMKLWVEKWEAEKRKNGLFEVDNEAIRW